MVIPATVQRLENRYRYHLALQHMDLEQMDLCGETLRKGEPLTSQQLGVRTFNEVMADATSPHPAMAASLRSADAPVPHGGKVLREIGGMGKVYDWRASPWTPVNGGKIKPLIHVHHIPVIPNMAGIADFVRLRDVLVAQGLMVQNATDRSGNVALFTPMNYLCYQARGANQMSCGTEHMHLTIGEEWSKSQLRAGAYVMHLANIKHGIPIAPGDLDPGNGVVRVHTRGQTTHRAVSDSAGYHDRTDPGPGCDQEYMRHCVRYYRKHHTMKNA